MRPALISLAFLATSLQAQDLIQYDMEQLPIAMMELEGGDFFATLYEEAEPFQSMIVFNCTNCAAFTEVIAGVTADLDDIAPKLMADPNAFVAQFAGECQQTAPDCIAGTVTEAGLPGYSYAGRFDGTVVIEHNYFANGLVYHIYSAAPVAQIAQDNAVYMLEILTPLVTGQIQ